MQVKMTTCLKLAKVTNIFDLCKVSKITNFLTCLKVCKITECNRIKNKNYYYYYYYYKKNYYKFFFRHIKKYFFVETYNNGKPHNTQTKANCRKKRY